MASWGRFRSRSASRKKWFGPFHLARASAALSPGLGSRIHSSSETCHRSLLPSQNYPFTLAYGEETMRLLLGHHVLIRCFSVISLAISMLSGHVNAQSVSLPVVTIQSGVPFKEQRQCVQNILNNLGSVLSCPSNGGYLESCWCRADLVPLAYSYISSAVPPSCNSNPPDLTSAISLYSSYCNVQGSVAAFTPSQLTLHPNILQNPQLTLMDG
jgi:hypothetical protein